MGRKKAIRQNCYHCYSAYLIDVVAAAIMYCKIFTKRSHGVTVFFNQKVLQKHKCFHKQTKCKFLYILYFTNAGKIDCSGENKWINWFTTFGKYVCVRVGKNACACIYPKSACVQVCLFVCVCEIKMCA